MHSRPLHSKRNLLLLLVCCGAFLGLGLVLSSEEPAPPVINPDPPGVKVFMRQKLTSSQQVLEGLTTKNFSLISKGAHQMLVMSQAAQWQVHQTPEYQQSSEEFQRNVRQLQKMAEEKNLDGASVSYLQVTLSCINCHKQVRESAVTLLPPLPEEVPLHSKLEPATSHQLEPTR